jgi:hypothetical protein
VRLYKFTAEKHMRSFFDDGTVRIGTIWTFNDTVAFGNAVGDARDGLKLLKRDVEEPLTVKDGEHQPLVNDVFIPEPGGSFTVQGITFVTRVAALDCYVFCCSDTYSDELFKRWYREDRTYDACYEISDSDRFFRRISRRFPLGRFAGSASCAYVPDTIDYQSEHAQISPILTKRASRYGWQREHRAVWNPSNVRDAVEARYVRVPYAARLCRPFALMRNGSVLRL